MSEVITALSGTQKAAIVLMNMGGPSTVRPSGSSLEAKPASLQRLLFRQTARNVP